MPQSAHTFCKRLLVLRMRIVPSFIPHNLWLLVVLVCVGNLSFAAAQDTSYVLWEPIQRMSFDPYTSTYAKVFATETDVFVTWSVTGAGPYFYVARSTDQGASWQRIAPLPDSGHYFGSLGEFAVAPPYMYFVGTYRPPPWVFRVWFRRWMIGDTTWGNSTVLYDSTDGRLVTASGANVVFDYLWYSRDIGDYFAHSSDWGTNWIRHPLTLPVRAFASGLSLLGNRLYMVRERGVYGSPETAFTYSTDFGATWATETFLSSLDTLVSDLPHVAADSLGNVYSVWRDGKYGSTTGWGATIMLRRSTDYGLTWFPEQVLTTIPSGLAPRVAVSGNYVIVAWQDEIPGPTLEISKIHCRVSFDRGATWSPEYDLTPNTTYNLRPDVAIGGGYVHVAWTDDVPFRNLEIFYRRGRIIVTGVPEIGDLPQEISLAENYPNPFNSSTRFKFSLPTRAHATVEIFNVLGQRIAAVADDVFNAGWHSVSWDASEHATGIYIVRLRAGGAMAQRKILLLK